MRYDFACKCGFVIEVNIPLAAHRDPMFLTCPVHGQSLFDQVLTASAIEDWGNCSEGRYFEHLAPLGMHFRDKRSYREHLKRNGLAEWAPRRGMPGQEV